MLGTILLVVAVVAAITVVVLATITEAKDSGWFRALTYWGQGALLAWGIYDHVKQYGARQTFLGHSKEEFAELLKSTKVQSRT
jgi:hypothetical protein